MIGTIRDVMVSTEVEFDRLPDDGLWEAVGGRAILLPPKDCEHQYLSDALVGMFQEQLKVSQGGVAVSTPNVFIQHRRESTGKFQNRVPDIAVSTHRPMRHFAVGTPPALVIEILATRRGDVERTEKLDDYALAGIAEYWIVNPFDRVVEVYVLRGDEYLLRQTAFTGAIAPERFSSVTIDLPPLWAAYGVA